MRTRSDIIMPCLPKNLYGVNLVAMLIRYSWEIKKSGAECTDRFIPTKDDRGTLIDKVKERKKERKRKMLCTRSLER